MELSLDSLCRDLQSSFPNPAEELAASQVELGVLELVGQVAAEALQEAGQPRRKRRSEEEAGQEGKRREMEPMEMIFLPGDQEEVGRATSDPLIKVKQEHESTGRKTGKGSRGKYKTKSVGKLAKKEVKEVKKERNIPCPHCGEEFKSAPDFNSHTIGCAKKLARRIDSKVDTKMGIKTKIIGRSSPITIAPTTSSSRMSITPTTNTPRTIIKSTTSSRTSSTPARPSPAQPSRIQLKGSPRVQVVGGTKVQVVGSDPEITILEPSMAKALSSSIKITHIPDSPSPRAPTKDPTTLMKSLPQSTKILFTPPSQRPTGPPGPPGPPGPGSKPSSRPPGPPGPPTLPPGPPGPKAAAPAQQMVCSKCRIILPSRKDFEAHIASVHMVPPAASPSSARAPPPGARGSPGPTKPLIATKPPGPAKPSPKKTKTPAKPPPPQFKCTKCKESFKSDQSMREHKCWAVCDKCSLTFTSKAQCEKHRRDVHTFRCTKCSFTAETSKDVASHHDEEHSHFCDKCGNVFDTKIQLGNHNVKEHSYRCEYCNKLFDSTELLAGHERAEHKACEECEDEFTWVDSRHSCYYTRNKVAPDSERVIVQNVYFTDTTYYFI